MSTGTEQPSLAVIGGGAAGCFAAIIAAETNPSISITLFEKSRELLGKVKISGGGRCNVTHYCFEPAELVKAYPRGHRELLGPFHRFGAGDMMQWLEDKGVALKHEPDGRVFPKSDTSSTVVECFIYQLFKNNIVIRKESFIDRLKQDIDGKWLVSIEGKEEVFDRVLVATGGSPAVWLMLERADLDIIPPVPSLFTFHIPDKRISDLPGISVPAAQISIDQTKFREQGPLLITHWGMSGPAILKLSARAARELADRSYRFTITINFTGLTTGAVEVELVNSRRLLARKFIQGSPMFQIPGRLWQSLCLAAGIDNQLRWADMSDKLLRSLHAEIAANSFTVNGKSTFKEEFVTAGGVSLKEVDFRTMQCRKLPGLYFAGEVLDIDAVTGGYNFQSAWTTAWIAAQDIAATL